MSSLAEVGSAVALENILYATDFSSCSNAALPFVYAFAKRYGSTVHIVHVCSTAQDSERSIAESNMKTLLSSREFSDVAHTSTMKHGALWKALAGVVEARNIDMIVLCTHGRRGTNKLALGSSSEQVFRHAQCPVLTLGPEAICKRVVDSSFSRILFATDYLPGSERALPYAVSLARMNKAHLMLLHVMGGRMEALPTTSEATSPGMQIAAEFVGRALVFGRRHLGELISPEIMRDLNPEIIVECGEAAEVIVASANNRQAHLIVMGAHRTIASSLADHIPGSVASSVISQAHCPVLTVCS